MRTRPSNPIPVLISEPFGELEGLSIVDGDATIQAILRNTDPNNLDTKARAALIEASRAGKHLELTARAVTFRQKDGHPNKNALRFKSSKLTEIGASFEGRPFLLNHDKWDQAARMGTIRGSEAVSLQGGWIGFRQQLHAVKPHAVQSVLDGTIDRFSIGWDPSGQVICTAHGVDVRSRKSCYWTEGCYPGKLVEVDGVKKIAEYEWQSTEGTETSAVNTPAVSGTKIEEVKTALAAELSLTDDTEEPTKGSTMRFPLLLAALALPSTGGAADLSEADDNRLAGVVTELRSELAAATEERDTAIKDRDAALKEATELKAKIAKLDGDKVESVLAAAYKAGKLLRRKDENGKDAPSLREPRLRRIAKEGGIAELEAELAEMPVVAPLGANGAVLAEADPNPKATVGAIPSSVLANTAKQLGLKPEELETHAATLTGGEGREQN